MEGRYSIAAAVWDSTGRGHRGREGEDTCISKFVACLQWRNLPFSALHTNYDMLHNLVARGGGI